MRRGPARGESGLLQQQLIEMRGRLEVLAETQREIPRALAEGRAEQVEMLTDHLGALARRVRSDLEVTRSSVDDRLHGAGRAVADVRERLGQLMEATTRVEALGREVAEVQQLLRVPNLRGALGEIWLEQLLREVFPSARYRMQHTFGNGTRVDAVLELGGRLVPIDAKFPLEACRRMLVGNEAEQERERRAFHRSLRARIDEIADKYIRPDEGTYDFALMYVPAERVYHEAVVAGLDANGDGILAYALGRQVIPVSPNTLYAYLMAIVHGLRGLRVEERAREILGALDRLRTDLDRFHRTHEVLGRHLDNAHKQYTEADKQLGVIEEQFRHAVEGSADRQVVQRPRAADGEAPGATS